MHASPGLWFEYIGALRRANRTEQAIAAAAGVVVPRTGWADRALLLPRLYASSGEIDPIERVSRRVSTAISAD